MWRERGREGEREREKYFEAELFLAVGIADCGAIVDNKVAALALLHHGLHEAIRDTGRPETMVQN